MVTSPDYPTTVDYANNLVNYIEVPPVEKPTAPVDAAETTPEAKPTPPQPQAAPAAPEEQAEVPPLRYRDVPGREEFKQQIPAYLNDLDQPEDSPAYHNAVMATDRLPGPPSLPGFLSKPILNVVSTRKDDNSVLPQPNHTVLNHLATSSIKHNVLAVSATTRYKGKVSHDRSSVPRYLWTLLTAFTVCHDYHVQAHYDRGYLMNHLLWVVYG
jgi:hypothetical protein